MPQMNPGLPMPTVFEVRHIEHAKIVSSKIRGDVIMHTGISENICHREWTGERQKMTLLTTSPYVTPTYNWDYHVGSHESANHIGTMYVSNTPLSFLKSIPPFL